MTGKAWEVLMSHQDRVSNGAMYFKDACVVSRTAIMEDMLLWEKPRDDMGPRTEG